MSLKQIVYLPNEEAFNTLVTTGEYTDGDNTIYYNPDENEYLVPDMELATINDLTNIWGAER